MTPASRKPAGASAGEVPLVPASSHRDGTPHPDPRLAAKGWQARHGIYVRIQPQGAASS